MSTAHHDPRLANAARDLVVALPKLLRVRALHEWRNRALVAPLAEVLAAAAPLARSGAPTTLQVFDHAIFVNRALLRFDSRTFEAARSFARMLAAHRVGALDLVAEPREPELRALVDLLLEHESGARDSFERIRDGLAGAEVSSFQVRAARALRHVDVAASAVDERSYTIVTYAKAVAVLREYVRRIDEPERALYAARAQRVVMDLVDAVANHGDRFLALAGLKHSREYLFTHSASTVVLSLLVGQRLGLGKAQLKDLGMAALFHDLGKALLPRELRGERRPFTALETRRMQLHPLHAVQHFMGVSRFSGSFFSRVLVAFECNVEANGYPLAELARPSHLFSRIVAIACNYDALTTPRPYRRSFLPDEALRVLWDGRGTRFDPILLRLFIERIGIFPVGSAVELTSGEIGLVVHNHHEPGRAAAPRVRIVADGGGRAVEERDLVDLGAASEVRRIRCTLEPTRTSPAVRRALAKAWSDPPRPRGEPARDALG